MATNIEMQVLLDSGEYEILYPKTIVNLIENAVSQTELESVQTTLQTNIDKKASTSSVNSKLSGYSSSYTGTGQQTFTISLTQTSWKLIIILGSYHITAVIKGETIGPLGGTSVEVNTNSYSVTLNAASYYSNWNTTGRTYNYFVFY